MANNPANEVRRATITRLKTDGAVTALQPSAQIYPQQAPTSPPWPYTYTGTPIVTPFRADCMDGATIRFAIHTYTKTGTGGDGESLANNIGKAIGASLDGLTMDLDTPYPSTADFTWISTQVVRDPSEASVFHSICQMEASVSA